MISCIRNRSGFLFEQHLEDRCGENEREDWSLVITDYLLQFVDPKLTSENTMRRGFAPIEESDDWVD